MTVNELIAKLQSISSDGGGERKVRFAYNYGDRGRTHVAQEVRRAEEDFVRQNDYVNNMALVECEDDAKDGDELAVVLQ